MRRDDRLRGLAQLAVIVGGPRITCAGVPHHVVSALSSGDVEVRSPGAEVDSALLVVESAAEAGALVQALPASVAAAWLVWRAGSASDVRRVVDASDFRTAARFGVVGDLDSPTHLVDLDRARSLRWFADSVRPAWGPRGRVARQVAKLPRVAAWGFGGRALLLSRSHARPWPLAPDHGYGPPAVIALGGGSTAGRSVATFADGRGAPARHVKIDPTSGAAPGLLMLESDALEVVGGLHELRGSVPVALGRDKGAGWQAFAQSHLTGVMLDRRWETRHRRGWDKDVADVIGWLSRASVASARLADSITPSAPPLADPPTGLSPGLRAAVTRGARLAAATPRLVHGDLWPANVVRGSAGVGVIDWESAATGHPLADTLSFLITATRHRLGGVATLADAGRVALCGSGASQTALWIRQVLDSLGAADLSPAQVLDLVAAQLLQVALHPSPGAEMDPARRAGWTECLSSFWARSDAQHD